MRVDNKKYSIPQKAMFGVELKERAEIWQKENPNLNKDSFADVVGVSRPVLYKAYNGNVSANNMERIAIKLNEALEDMTSFTTAKFRKHLKNRINEDAEFRFTLISLFFLIYFAVLYLINCNLMNLLLFVVAISAGLHFASNLWRLDIEVKRKDKVFMKVMDIIGILAFITVLILGVLHQF